MRAIPYTDLVGKIDSLVQNILTIITVSVELLTRTLFNRNKLNDQLENTDEYQPPKNIFYNVSEEHENIVVPVIDFVG